MNELTVSPNPRTNGTGSLPDMGLEAMEVYIIFSDYFDGPLPSSIFFLSELL